MNSFRELIIPSIGTVVPRQGVFAGYPVSPGGDSKSHEDRALFVKQTNFLDGHGNPIAYNLRNVESQIDVLNELGLRDNGRLLRGWFLPSVDNMRYNLYPYRDVGAFREMFSGEPGDRPLLHWTGTTDPENRSNQLVVSLANGSIYSVPKNTRAKYYCRPFRMGRLES